MIDFYTGEVVKARLRNFPVIYHFGIAVNIDSTTYIVHHPLGSTPKIEPCDRFFQTRYLDKITGLLNVSDDFIIEKFEQMRYRKFDLVDSNCEDFVNDIIGSYQLNTAKKDFAVVVSSFLLIALK